MVGFVGKGKKKRASKILKLSDFFSKSFLNPKQGAIFAYRNARSGIGSNTKKIFMTLSTPRGIQNGRLFEAYRAATIHTEPADGVKFPRGYHSSDLVYFVHCGRFYAVLSSAPLLIISHIKF